MTKKTSPHHKTKKRAKVTHPGMMGDGTEEQNLGERGNPAARIKKNEVTPSASGPKIAFVSNRNCETSTRIMKSYWTATTVRLLHHVSDRGRSEPPCAASDAFQKEIAPVGRLGPDKSSKYQPERSTELLAEPRTRTPTVN
jgi:hypothetical protein